MYKKILIPTDGSPLATETAMTGIDFAREAGAQVVAIYVAPEDPALLFLDMVPPDYPARAQHDVAVREAGAQMLAVLEQAAKAGGVAFSQRIEISDRTAQEIVNAAEAERCDLIFMGSHGRSGWQRLILGSVTAKVLAACQIPVLVHRTRQAT